MNATGEGGSPTNKESSITHSVAFGLMLPPSVSQFFDSPVRHAPANRDELLVKTGLYEGSFGAAKSYQKGFPGSSYGDYSPRRTMSGSTLAALDAGA